MEAALSPRTTWLIRHGQSYSNAGAPASLDHGEVALTPLGVRQAEAVAARIDRCPDLLVVSPYLRAAASAEPIRLRWPAAKLEVWPIQELTYLSPALCAGTTVDTRRPMVEDYWERSDPFYRHGPDAETFVEFMRRIGSFRERLIARPGDFAAIVGHGQFFRAFLEGLDGWEPTAASMQRFRRTETSRPMANGEVIVIEGP
jgi:broad specificity phosphatase PhoE